jgi:hypothetical protein
VNTDKGRPLKKKKISTINAEAIIWKRKYIMMLMISKTALYPGLKIILPLP